MNAIARNYPIDNVPDHGNDLGVAFHLRPSVMESTEGKSKGSATRGVETMALRMLVECRMDKLLVDGKIADPQWRAGMLFRLDWMGSRKAFRVTANYAEPMGGGGGGNDVRDASDRRLSAKQRITDLTKSMGQLHWAAVCAVCGEDENPLSPAGRLAHLRDGLDLLVTFYRVPNDYKRFRTTGR